MEPGLDLFASRLSRLKAQYKDEKGGIKQMVGSENCFQYLPSNRWLENCIFKKPGDDCAKRNKSIRKR